VKLLPHNNWPNNGYDSATTRTSHGKTDRK
jgi:hypothetical protein